MNQRHGIAFVVAFSWISCVGTGALAQSLCSAVSDELGSQIPAYSCNGTDRSTFSLTQMWLVSRWVQYSTSCPSYVSEQRDGSAEGSGECGVVVLGLGEHCPPLFYSTVDLQGSGQNYDEYSHVWKGWARSRIAVPIVLYTVCLSVGEDWAGSPVTFSAWNCRTLQPGETCPDQPE